MFKRSKYKYFKKLAFIAFTSLFIATTYAKSPTQFKSLSTLLADTGGQAKSIVISINSARRAALRSTEFINNIINQLPPSTTIYIVVNDLSAFTVKKNAWPDRIHFIQLPFDNSITIWTQDPFLVLNGGLNKQYVTLLTSKEFERAGDSLMAEKIADFANFSIKKSELYFEGGNIVSDNEFIFIGANTIRYNAVVLGIDEKDVVNKFQQELGRQVLVIGPLPQPIAHIDMMLTPLGKGRIALADATAGIAIAERVLKNNPAEVANFEKFCEKSFFGHPEIKSILGQEGRILTAPDLRGKTQEMIKLSRSIAPVLDKIALSLKRYGYQVERIPFLFGGPKSRDVTKNTAMVAAYPMLTYNNILLDSNKNLVYLPRYGWATMDIAAAKAWQVMGFTPIFIDGLTISAMYGGALRCAVKVLEK